MIDAQLEADLAEELEARLRDTVDRLEQRLVEEDPGEDEAAGSGEPDAETASAR